MDSPEGIRVNLLTFVFYKVKGVELAYNWQTCSKGKVRLAYLALDLSMHVNNWPPSCETVLFQCSVSRSRLFALLHKYPYHIKISKDNIA
jgi:hypothetical protein